jgi:hypothetical protein
MINWIVTIIGLVFLLLGIGTCSQSLDVSPLMGCLFLPLGLFMSLGGGFSLEKEYSLGVYATSTEEETNDSEKPDIKDGLGPWGIATTVVTILLVSAILLFIWFAFYVLPGAVG